MKVAHLSVFSPNRCGLYHTAKELVLAERLVGIDARFIDCDGKSKQKDGDFETEDLKWAYKADILVRHSVIPTHLQSAGIPVVLALHGRPESSVRLEQSNAMKVMSSLHNKAKDARYKGYVTFWLEYKEIWSRMIPEEKMFYVPAMVDLKEYSPSNKPFDFGGYNSSPNVLISDLWREDVMPFNVLFAAAKFVEGCGGKVHIAGIPKEWLLAMSPFLTTMRKKGLLGYIFGQITFIKGMYTASDILVTPHIIATRSVRESLASGIPIVAGTGNKYTTHTANPMDIEEFAKAIHRCWKDKKQNPRKIAEAAFGLKQSGEAMKKVLEKILNGKKNSRRKVFVDIGGHLGESVRRFYREVSDAGEYEIYSFEPDLATFRILDANVGHIKNVNLINACVGNKDGMVDFYVGKHNQNEGGTCSKGKQTGGVDYVHPVKVESVDFARWMKANVNGDYVVVKMNIEGGEYDLMEKILDEDIRIDKCFIQLHAHKFEQGPLRQRYQAIESRFFNEAKCKKYMTNKGSYPFNVQ